MDKFDINEWAIRRMFYGYQQGATTGDSPEQEYLSPAVFDPDGKEYNSSEEKYILGVDIEPECGILEEQIENYFY